MTDLNDVRKDIALVKILQDKVAEHKAAIADLEEQIEEPLARIKDAVGTEGTGELDGQPVFRTWIVRQRRLDTKTIRETFPDIADVCTKVLEIKRSEFL